MQARGASESVTTKVKQSKGAPRSRLSSRRSVPTEPGESGDVTDTTPEYLPEHCSCIAISVFKALVLLCHATAGRRNDNDFCDVLETWKMVSELSLGISTKRRGGGGEGEGRGSDTHVS